MRKYLSLILIIFLLILLVGCNKVDEIDKNPNNNDISIEKDVTFKAEILEVFKNTILVKPMEGEKELNCADKISVKTSEINTNFEYNIGQIIDILYNGIIKESYPAQISAKSITLIKDIEKKEFNVEYIEYNNYLYKIDELSIQTLAWLALSEEERNLSNYFPPEFTKEGQVSIDEPKEECFLTFEVDKVTPKGLFFICNLTCNGDGCNYESNNYFIIQKLENNEYIDVPDIVANEIVWTDDKLPIKINSYTPWEIDWEWLYGELAPGKYRIGKEILKINEDNNKKMFYVEFEIK